MSILKACEQITRQFYFKYEQQTTKQIQFKIICSAPRHLRTAQKYKIYKRSLSTNYLLL